ncbi:MAG: CPBP family intramembrane metalloprotease [Eubacterium sp.]|nr:CPBP family intramembrane metalloprotease [Eubacterium sp.]
MYPHNTCQNQKNTMPDKTVSACTRLKVLLHVPVITAIYFLTMYFSDTALAVCRPGICAVTLYICMNLCSMLAVIHLYSKYILKSTFGEMYLAKPGPGLKWCMAALLLPAAEDLFYLMFIDGRLETHGLFQPGLVTVLYTDLFSSGLRTAVSDGLLFRGLALFIFQKGVQKKYAALLSGILYAGMPLLPVYGSPWCFQGMLQQSAALFLLGFALALVTLGTGSIWPSVVIHAAYNILSGDSHIIHIGIEQTYPALCTYTLLRDDWLTAGIPSPDSLYTALPSMFVFVIIIVFFIRKESLWNTARY